jgi:hypothetical protein
VPLIALLCGLFVCEPALAQDKKSFFTARRSLGLFFIGSSLALTKKGFDFHDEADELYARYKRAATPEEADRLYSRTNNRDVKSQVSWALAAAFAVSGVRLLIDSSSGGEFARSASGREEKRFALVPQLEARRFGVHLKRRFF